MARRPAPVFSLSFLDSMCCGFGAVILIFMIISARIQEDSELRVEDLQFERERLQLRVDAGATRLEELREALASALEGRSVAAIERRSLEKMARDARSAATSGRSKTEESSENLKALADSVRGLEQARQAALEEAEKAGQAIHEVTGVGNRQYLTGMRMGGRRILILVDTSGSMLASTLVNVVRRRYLPDEQKRRADKWQQVVQTVSWITAHMPRDSRFQIYGFAAEATPLAGEDGNWIDVADREALRQGLARLEEIVPAGGTSLHAAFGAIRRMSPPPDNVYLLVDGLPTRGSEAPRRRTVSGRQRLKHFQNARRRLPTGVPLNVVLYAMEGDPDAADSFWRLARATRGSFLSPSKDWP